MLLIVSYQIWSKNFRVTFHNPFQSYHPLPCLNPHYCPISTTLWLIQLLALSQTYPAVFLLFFPPILHTFSSTQTLHLSCLISDANEVFPNALPPPFPTRSIPSVIPWFSWHSVIAFTVLWIVCVRMHCWYALLDYKLLRIRSLSCASCIPHTSLVPDAPKNWKNWKQLLANNAKCFHWPFWDLCHATKLCYLINTLFTCVMVDHEPKGYFLLPFLYDQSICSLEEKLWQT